MSQEIRQANNPTCNYCQSDNVIKYGKQDEPPPKIEQNLKRISVVIALAMAEIDSVEICGNLG